MNQAAVYVRVSTKNKQDIGTQIDFLAKYAESQQLKVYKLYQDVGESGSKASRPSFDEMLEDMKAGKFQAILVYKLDRIGRSVQNLLQLFDLFKQYNIEFISATQAINTKTPEGKMFLQLLMVFAEYEKELTINRIYAGLDRARDKGKRLGRPKGARDKRQRSKFGYYKRWNDVKNQVMTYLLSFVIGSLLKLAEITIR